MKAPDFWTRPPGLGAALLAPLGWLYAAGTRRRLGAGRPWRAPVPVVCVGNLSAGGTGKTPVVLDLARRLAARGRAPHLITRGHGGALAGPVRVDPETHDATAVGDEARLLARAAPTWVARDRRAGAEAAVAAGAGVLVLDDGHQNPALVKDLSLVVVDGSVGFGNGRVIPAGPLREPVAEGLARADALVILGDDARHVASQAGNRPVLRARVVADGADLAGRDVLAFAGIGRPGKLFDTLRGLGARVVAERSFADHHPYTAAEIAALKARAAGMGALLVTTEKDAARLLADQVAGIHVLTITLQWADEGTLDALLDRLDP